MGRPDAESNADCPDPPGPVGPICGGRRCIGGGNEGVPCAVNSECPGSVCSRPGAGTQSNDCNDAVCSPNPSDTDSIDEGTCAAGPTTYHCTIETYRQCTVDADCFVVGDTCDLVEKDRECFTDDGMVGGDVSVGGVASPTAPTLGGLFCMPPTLSSTVNLVIGLPGLGRATIAGTSTFN